MVLLGVARVNGSWYYIRIRSQFLLLTITHDILGIDALKLTAYTYLSGPAISISSLSHASIVHGIDLGAASTSKNGRE